MPVDTQDITNDQDQIEVRKMSVGLRNANVLETMIKGSLLASDKVELIVGERKYPKKTYQSYLSKYTLMIVRARLDRDGYKSEIKTHMGPQKSLLLLIVEKSY